MDCVQDSHIYQEVCVREGDAKPKLKLGWPRFLMGFWVSSGVIFIWWVIRLELLSTTYILAKPELFTLNYVNFTNNSIRWWVFYIHFSFIKCQVFFALAPSYRILTNRRLYSHPLWKPKDEIAETNPIENYIWFEISTSVTVPMTMVEVKSPWLYCYSL
jgi:hypothetical protein